MPVPFSSPARALAAILVALALAPLAAAAAVDRASVEQDFRRWTEQAVWPAARERGISRATFERAFAGVSLEWSVPDIVPPGTSAPAEDWRQAEFRAPARYFNQGNIETLVALGRQKLDQHRATLDAIEARYGVPRAILIAIWARESAFGRASVPHDAMTILATQAFMGRRRELFTPELIAALEILEQGHVTREEMRSSWAGALGQPQFLPTKYLAYAVDGDGDGRSDIWNSVPDTLASIANFLRQNGWQSGRDWGFEAVVPESVPCTLEGPDQGRPIDEWIALGVARVAGRAFPGHERPLLGYLMMPAGRRGPAFIATENFYVLKAYNESDLYALFVGHLADRLGANRPFIADWRPLGGFTRADVHAMQTRFEALGYDVGGVDGLVGFKTRRSVGDFQRRHGLEPTCFPDAEVIRLAR